MYFTQDFCQIKSYNHYKDLFIYNLQKLRKIVEDIPHIKIRWNLTLKLPIKIIKIPQF